MKKLLYVKASPRHEKSISLKLGDEFVAAYKKKHSGAVIDEIDLWEAKLPEFDGDSAAAKVSFFGEPAMNEKQKIVYDELVAIFNRFNTADDYLFATPLWNFGVPYKLKQYIDILSMPGTLFGWDPKVGYLGLLKNKRASIVSTAAIYMPGLPKAYGSDHSTQHLIDWLNFAGINDVSTTWFYGSKMRDEIETEKAYNEAVASVRNAAQR